MDATVLLQILPLISATLWFAVAAIPFVRYRYGTPLRGIIAASFFALGLWALLDWIFLGLQDAMTAIALSNVRISVFTFGTLALLLAAKWLYVGRSRYDVLLLLPVVGSFGLIWGGMTYDVEFVAWGPRLIRNQLFYILWASQQVAYLGTATAIVAALYLSRQDLQPRLRRRFFWSAGSLVLFLAGWLVSNMYNNVTQGSGIPWLSSILIVPAAMIIIAFAPLSAQEIGEIFRAVTKVAQRVSAVYVFYKSGEPLVALGSSRNLPIEAEQLEGVLDVVGNFVETSLHEFRGYSVTALRFDRLGIVAVRGQHVIAAAIYEGPAQDTLRGELLRSIRAFEERRSQDLQTWEGATRIAEEVADDLSKLMSQPPPPYRPVSAPGMRGAGASVHSIEEPSRASR